MCHSIYLKWAGKTGGVHPRYTWCDQGEANYRASNGTEWGILKKHRHAVVQGYTMESPAFHVYRGLELDGVESHIVWEVAKCLAAKHHGDVAVVGAPSLVVRALVAALADPLRRERS